MKFLDELLATLPDGEVLDVCIGLHWTAVVARSNGQVRCGLASTLAVPHDHSAEPDIPQAGQLHTLSALKLAQLACSEHPTQARYRRSKRSAAAPTGGMARSER